MPLRGKTPFALLASLLFTFVALEFASAQSSSPVVVPARTPVSISEESKPALETLRMIAKQIEECPKALDFERRWGKKEDEIERYYEEPPANVVWDVAAGNSVRAPYLGYVEFTVDEDHWVPDSAGQRFQKSSASIAYVTIMGAYPRHYRYEYDLGPDGLRLTRALLLNKSTGEWVEPKRSVIAEYCWDAAARDTQIKVKVLPDKRGQDVPPGNAQAASLRKAAEQGDAVAQHTLGVFYSHGQGVPHDDAQAAFWWRKAAEQNYATAQFYLGLSHSIGKGVPQDKAEAYFWITLAASSQKIEGVKQEDVLTSINDVTADLNADLKPSDLSRVLSHAQERARKWFEDHPSKP